MSNFDYAKIQTKVNSNLGKFGQSVTINKKTTGAYDPATGTATVTASTQTGVGVVFDVNKKDIDNTLVLQGDKTLLLSQIGIDNINVNDSVTIGTKTYNVTSVQDLNPAGTNVMYTCNIRGV